jgi:hypothetical protein
MRDSFHHVGSSGVPRNGPRFSNPMKRNCHAPNARTLIEIAQRYSFLRFRRLRAMGMMPPLNGEQAKSELPNKAEKGQLEEVNMHLQIHCGG